MIIKTTQDVGTPPVEFNNNDIFKLHIDPADPQQWEAELLYTIGADVSALSALWEDSDIILFSFSDLTATLGGTEFSRGEVIKYDPGGRRSNFMATIKFGFYSVGFMMIKP